MTRGRAAGAGRPHTWANGECTRCAMRAHWPGAQAPCCGNRDGVTERPARYATLEDVAGMVRLYNAGQSVGEIAQAVGKGRRAVQRAVSDWSRGAGKFAPKAKAAGTYIPVTLRRGGGRG